MRGPEILARTLSRPTRRGKASKAWQYHSRSDAHSKIGCWTLLFDLLLACDVLRRHAEAGRLGFGINFELIGPINKTLDLVLTRPSGARQAAARRSFAGLVDQLGIELDEEDRRQLALLPEIAHDDRKDSSEILLALEAKACMTEHVKALPRLHAEILATGYLAKRAQPHAILVSYSLVNSAPTFCTPSGAGKINVHPAEAAPKVLSMLAQAVPLSRDMNNLIGYNVIGASVIRCANDGTPVVVDDALPWPERTAHIRYERMITAICAEIRERSRG